MLRISILLFLKVLAESPGGVAYVFFKIIGKCRSIFKATGKGDFRDGIRRIAKHLCGNPKSMLQEILLWREAGLFHENFVQIGSVNANKPCNIRDADRVSIIVFYVFLCLSEVLCGIIFFGNGVRMGHAG